MKSAKKSLGENRAVNQTGFTLVDLVLILTILGSAGLIGYKLMKRKTNPPIATQPAAVEPAAEPTVTLPPVYVKPDDVVAPGTLMGIRDPEWAKLKSTPAMAQALSKRTSGCAANGRLDAGFTTPDPEVARRFEAGKMTTLFAFMRPPCVEVGQVVQVALFDRALGTPMMKHLGSVTVQEIYNLSLKQIPDQIFELNGFNRQQISKHLSKFRSNRDGKEQIESVVRISPLVKPAKPLEKMPPMLFPKGRVLMRRELAAFQASMAPYLLVDVRSPQEYAAGSLPGAINVPFEAPPGLDKKLFWNAIKTAPTGRPYTIDQSRLKPDTYLVLIGTNASDARPFWAAISLFGQGYENLVWLYDGIAPQ